MGSYAPTSLDRTSSIAFRRNFHVELLRGGMNRLLLRALPTKTEPSRIEVFFQYVQRLEIPMAFSSLRISDATSAEKSDPIIRDVLQRFPECRVFVLESNGNKAGRIVASACVHGEDQAPLGAKSMFPFMD